MNAPNHAAHAAVKAAALPAESKNVGGCACAAKIQTQKVTKVEAQPMAHIAQPRDVFDCMAAGIPRDEWEAALDHSEARAWAAWLGEPTAKSNPQKERELQLQATREEEWKKQVNSRIFDLDEKLWHLDAVKGALNAVATMTDTCAFHAGTTLDVTAQDMAHLLNVLQADMARRTEAASTAYQALQAAWKGQP